MSAARRALGSCVRYACTSDRRCALFVALLQPVDGHTRVLYSATNATAGRVLASGRGVRHPVPRNYRWEQAAGLENGLTKNAMANVSKREKRSNTISARTF